MSTIITKRQFPHYHKYTMDLAGRPLTLEVGKLAELANAAVMVGYGDTRVLCCVTAAPRPRDGIDFFPLSVDFEEKMYSVGRIPGSFNRREGRPGEKGILTSRVIDRPIRPLFPYDFRNDVSVMCTVMAVDHDCSPEIAALIGTSAALAISDIPWNGPVAALKVGLVDGKLVFNPDAEQRKVSDLDVTVVSTAKKVVMIEAGANEVPNDKMFEAIQKAHEENQKQIELINNSGCSGVILLGTEMFLEDYRPFQSLHVPLVVLDSYYDELPFTTVLINNARGAFLATNYLVSEGHRNIGYLQSARAISNFEERADGFFRALRQNEIKKNMSYVFRVTPVQGVAYREFSRILDTHPALPTGFFADNDIIALDCIRALKEHGYRIPDDVSVVGFDDIPSCQLLEPPMTTTCVPKSFLGAQAMHQLLRLFADPILPPVKVEISTELVKRSTVRRLS